MQMTASKLVMLGWCVAFVILSVCAVSVLIPGATPNWGLPLFFWTLMGLLLIVATAAAVGLPHEKAGPWRTLLVTLYVCRLYHDPLQFSNLSYQLLGLLFPSWKRSLQAGPGWDASVIQMLVYLAIAGAAALIALAIARRPSPKLADGYLKFRMFHLFALSTFVALTCVAMRYGSPVVHTVVLLASFALRVTAAICASAGVGNSRFLWGFLFGGFTWEILVDHWQFAAEWDEWLPRSLLQDRPGWPVEDQYDLLIALLTVYAGITAGLLAALFYQRAEPSPINKKGHAEA